MTRPGERQVTLVNGVTVSNYSLEWIAECEARTVCKMPRKHDRRMYLIGVEKKRGKDAMVALERLIFAVWDAEFRSGA